MRKIIVFVFAVLLIVVGATIASGAAGSAEWNTDTRETRTVTVRTQTRVVPLSCSRLTSGQLQVRRRAIGDDFVTPWTGWKTVRIIENYANPDYPACSSNRRR